MSIQLQDTNHRVRNVSHVGVVDGRGRFRNGIGIKMNVGGVLRTIWEPIDAYIFTADGYGVMTKDGYIVKCKDQ